MKINSIVLFCTLLFCLSGCFKSKEDELKAMIKAVLAKDKGISAAECATFKNFIQAETSLKKYENEVAFTKLVNNIARSMSKDKKNSIRYPVSICADSTPPKPIHFNLYLENSASMDGYIEGGREFEEALYRLLTNINGRKDSCHLHFINQDTFPIHDRIDQVMGFLSKDRWTTTGGRGNSRLNDIFKQTIDIYKTDKKPIILVSDYIYSLDNGDIVKQLAMNKASTTIAFQSINSETAVLVIQNFATFSGSYYDLNNQGVKLSNQKRPYYIWVIGQESLINDFVAQYGVELLKGFQDYCILKRNQPQNVPYNALLTATDKKGSFRSCSNGADVACMKAVELKNNLLEFSIAVDLGATGVNESYKISPENYIVTSPSHDSLAVVAVKPIDQIKSNDNRFKGTATHYVVIRTHKLRLGQTLKLKLKKQLPQWVTDSNTENDSAMLTDTVLMSKTFGLQYLMSGVFQAYAPEKENYFFEIPIIINQ